MHFHFFAYKCLCDQIWPWPKIGQGHPRVTIYPIYDGPTSQMLHTKFHANRPSGSGEDFWRVFTIYGHGTHLGHVTWTPYANFRSPIPWRLHMKFDFNRPSGSRGEDIWKCEHTTHRQTDRQQPCHMISSPISLWLRWAKNLCRNEKFGKPNLHCLVFSCMARVSAGDKLRKWYFLTESVQQDEAVLPIAFYLALKLWYNRYGK